MTQSPTRVMGTRPLGAWPVLNLSLQGRPTRSFRWKHQWEVEGAVSVSGPELTRPAAQGPWEVPLVPLPPVLRAWRADSQCPSTPLPPPTGSPAGHRTEETLLYSGCSRLGGDCGFSFTSVRAASPSPAAPGNHHAELGGRGKADSTVPGSAVRLP